MDIGTIIIVGSNAVTVIVTIAIAAVKLSVRIEQRFDDIESKQKVLEREHVKLRHTVNEALQV